MKVRFLAGAALALAIGCGDVEGIAFGPAVSGGGGEGGNGGSGGEDGNAHTTATASGTTTSTVVIPPGCGDGTVDEGEECDDGNKANGDTCDVNCTKPKCGNGVAAGEEQCDDGNTMGGDNCSPSCTHSTWFSAFAEGWKLGCGIRDGDGLVSVAVSEGEPYALGLDLASGQVQVVCQTTQSGDGGCALPPVIHVEVSNLDADLTSAGGDAGISCGGELGYQTLPGVVDGLASAGFVCEVAGAGEYDCFFAGDTTAGQTLAIVFAFTLL